MKDQTARVPWWRERLLFAALLLALASALVPALFPSGSPMSRLHGSAFDPSTSTVTLRVRSQDERTIAPPADPQGGKRAPQEPLVPGRAPVPEAAHPAHARPIAFAAPVPAPPARARPAGIALPPRPADPDLTLVPVGASVPIVQPHAKGMVMKRKEETSPPPWWFRPLVYLGAALAGVALVGVATA